MNPFIRQKNQHLSNEYCKLDIGFACKFDFEYIIHLIPNL